MPQKQGQAPRRRLINWRWPILVAWCGFLFFYGLAGPLYRTESLRAIIGQAALDGHWTAPTLYGEPFLTKPPGAYAAIGLASIPFGRVTEESARLPSAFAATFTVLFAFATLRRYLGVDQAFVAALLLPVSLTWLDKAPSAEIDMLQLAWVASALFSFLRAVEEKEAARPAWIWWVVSLLCVAGGFLTKWTAPAFFYLALAPFLWQRGRLRWLVGREHLLAASLCIALCGMWALVVAKQVGWQALYDTIYQEARQRFAPQTHGKPYPWAESLKFPLIVLGANLPWSIPALLTLRPAFLRSLGEDERRLMQLLHCWAWPNLLFWSLPAQHHVRYVLPMCPAISLLGIVAITHWLRSPARNSRRFVSGRPFLIGILACWIVVKIVFVESVLPARTADRNARATGQKLAALVPEGDILYLCRLKDEGVLFYYGRPARRVSTIKEALASRYFLLLDEEWASSEWRDRFVEVATLRDQQRAMIHLVRRREIAKDDPGWLAPKHPTLPMSSPSQP